MVDGLKQSFVSNQLISLASREEVKDKYNNNDLVHIVSNQLISLASRE